MGALGWLQNWPTNYVVPGTGTATNHNYCRNPDLDSRPWCFTGSGSADWAYCDIAQCEPDVCNPAQEEEDFTYSQCFKWGVAHNLTIETVHVGSSTTDATYLPTSVDRVNLTP